jgi:hypothetical protein
MSEIADGLDCNVVMVVKHLFDHCVS